MFSSKQTWQNESVSFSVPSLQTLQTLSSSKSMLTNCSSFIVPLGGGDKGRDRYFNRHPGEAPAAPRLGRRPAAPHHAAAAPPPPGPRPRPAPTRQAESGTREGASQESFFLRARGGGGGGGQRSGRTATEPSRRLPARAPLLSSGGWPVPSRSPPSSIHRRRITHPPPSSAHRRHGRSATARTAPAPLTAAPFPAAARPSAALHYCSAASASAAGAWRQAPPAASGRDQCSCGGGGGRGGWALGPRSAAPERLTSPQSRAMKGGEAEGASGCRLPAPPRGHSHRELPCSPAVLGSPRARLQCLPRAGERGRGGG